MITPTEETHGGLPVWLVTCNRSGCLRPDWPTAPTQEEADASLIVDGWKVEGRRHVCPSCLATDGIPHEVQARDAAYGAGVL